MLRAAVSNWGASGATEKLIARCACQLCLTTIRWGSSVTLIGRPSIFMHMFGKRRSTYISINTVCTGISFMSECSAFEKTVYLSFFFARNMVYCLCTATYNYENSQYMQLQIAVTNTHSYAQVHTLQHMQLQLCIITSYGFLRYLRFRKRYLWHHSNNYDHVDVIADALKRRRCSHPVGRKHNNRFRWLTRTAGEHATVRGLQRSAWIVFRAGYKVTFRNWINSPKSRWWLVSRLCRPLCHPLTMLVMRGLSFSNCTQMSFTTVLMGQNPSKQ